MNQHGQLDPVDVPEFCQLQFLTDSTLPLRRTPCSKVKTDQVIGPSILDAHQALHEARHGHRVVFQYDDGLVIPRAPGKRPAMVP